MGLGRDLDEGGFVKDGEVGVALGLGLDLGDVEALGADHIVVGTGDRKGVVNWLMGSTAKAVAARAPVSVTIAR